MIHRSFYAFFLFCVATFVSVSCSDDQNMPMFNTTTTETTTDDNSPKTSIGLEQVFDFNFDDADNGGLRTFYVGQEDVNNGSIVYQKPVINWRVGDKYRFYAVVRYVNLNDQSDWRPNFSNDGFYLEILSYDSKTKTGTFKIKGNINVKSQYIDTSGKMPKFKDPNNWYFGGFIGGKLNDDGTQIVDDMGISKTFEGKDVKGISIKSPNVFTAVYYQNPEFKLNFPVGVPLEHIELSGSNQNVWMNSLSNKPLKLQPIGNLLCVRLKNELVHSVAIPNSATINISSKFLLDCDVTFGLWYTKDKLPTIGTNNFAFKYDVVGGTTNKVDSKGYRNNVSMTIDWSQYHPNRTGDQDVLLRMNETVNLYVWSMYNTDYNVASSGNEHNIDIDFTGLNLKVPQYNPIDNRKPQVSFVNVGSGDSKVKYFGGADDYSSTWMENYPGLEVDFLRKKTDIKQTGKIVSGASFVVPFAIRSELYISEVYYSWKKDKNCYNILEIFNPNSTEADLSEYYLLRLIYPQYGDRRINKIDYWGPGGNKTDRFQNAYLMPLDFETKKNGKVLAVTPAGYSSNQMFIYNSYTGQVNGVGNRDSFQAKALVYAPSSANVNSVSRRMPAGFCLCLGGHGVYEAAKSGQRDIKDAGLFSSDELGPQAEAVKMYTNYLINTMPERPQFGVIYGVIDGLVDVDKYASSKDASGGSMVRDNNQGWALVKRINGKFYIIDSFGPTYNYTNSTMIPGDFYEAMNRYRSSNWDYPSNWFERKQNVLYPNGGFFYGWLVNKGSTEGLPQWTIRTNNTDKNHSIGSRTRYYSTAGRVGNGNIPCLFGKDINGL